jgi:hypothetical protein
LPIVVTVRKPATPTLWLDSSILIKLAKLRRGEEKDPRLEKLRSLVLSLVKDGRLAVPEGEQDEEYALKRLDEDVAVEQARLSRGVRMKSRFEVTHALTLRGMEAFVRGESGLELDRRYFFAWDPGAVLQERRNDRILAVSSPGTVVTGERRALRSEKVVVFEPFRGDKRKAGVKYEEQLALELSGDGRGWLRDAQDLIRRISSGEAPDLTDVMGFQTLHEFRVRWDELGGTPAGWPGVFGYFDSDVYKALPPVLISAQLSADILTGNEPLQAGDPGDIEMLSVAIPACSFVLADNRQRLRIEQRRIAEPWGAAVFSMKTVDSLIGALEAL